jgi:ferritin-like metal-binding protein YciE
MSETAGAPELLDTAIATAAAKVEHYEMACYRNLIATAERFDQPAVSDLLRRNLEQEERTAEKVEDGYKRLLSLAISTQKLQSALGGPTVL